MNKFYYSRTYAFDTPSQARKHYFFNLVERHGSKAMFRLNDKDNIETVETDMVIDGDTETAAFSFHGMKISLRADRYTPKGYPSTTAGRIEKVEDRLRDAHLHTFCNRNDIEHSKVCYCISCQTFFMPEEVVDYADGGQTGICPYCGCDAIIADGSGIKMSDRLFIDLHMRYFNFSTNPLIELTIDNANESKPTHCHPYVWIVRIQNNEGCAVDTGYYTQEEAPGKLKGFLNEIPTILFRTTYEAVSCKLHDIDGVEATVAISAAIAIYFGGDIPKFKIERDIDFAITTAWNGETNYFTLLTDGDILLPSA